MGLDILGLDILGLDILGLDILGRFRLRMPFFLIIAQHAMRIDYVIEFKLFLVLRSYFIVLLTNKVTLYVNSILFFQILYAFIFLILRKCLCLGHLGHLKNSLVP